MKIFVVAVLFAVIIAVIAYKQKQKQYSQLEIVKRSNKITAVIDSRPIIAFSKSQELVFVVKAKEVIRIPTLQIEKIKLITPNKISKGSLDERAIMRDYGYIILNNTDKIKFEDMPITTTEAKNIINNEITAKVEIK